MTTLPTALSPELLARYGLPGEPIAGSKHVRAYCCRCGDPMRIAPPPPEMHQRRQEHAIGQCCDLCREQADTPRAHSIIGAVASNLSSRSRRRGGKRS